jgi:CheY-like chemotaxis protein
MKNATEAKILHVLLVENHGDTLESLKLYLEDFGHQVSTAMTLSDADRLLRSTGCDLLICDIGLPDGSGWELSEILKAKPEIFAVAMSGFGQNADNARSRAAGFRHHLLKPFRAAELDKVLAEASAERGV